jgi:hypothetical protein
MSLSYGKKTRERRGDIEEARKIEKQKRGE